MRTERIAVEDILLRKRIREDMGDLASLKKSIREYGLLNPILIDDQNYLVAGERRLRAVRDMGWVEIEARVVDNLDRVALFDIEVHENLLRKEFTEQEVAKSIEEKKKLLNPPWFIRCRDWFVSLKQRVFGNRPKKRALPPPASFDKTA